MNSLEKIVPLIHQLTVNTTLWVGELVDFINFDVVQFTPAVFGIQAPLEETLDTRSDGYFLVCNDKPKSLVDMGRGSQPAV